MSCHLHWIKDEGKTCCEGLLEDHQGESKKNARSNLTTHSLSGNGCSVFLCRAPKEENIKGVEPINLGCGVDNMIHTILKYEIVYHMISSDFCKQPNCHCISWPMKNYAISSFPNDLNKF